MNIPKEFSILFDAISIDPYLFWSADAESKDCSWSASFLYAGLHC